MGAQPVRVGQILDGERMLRQAGEALEIDPGAERDHQLVIGEVDGNAPRALDDDDALLGEVDAHDLGLPHLEAAKQLAQRHDRVGGMDAGRGDLGQQRLKHEIIIGVDQLDIELAPALPLERLGREHAAKAAADHQDLFLRHGLFHRASLVYCPGIPTPMLHCVKSRFAAPQIGRVLFRPGQCRCSHNGGNIGYIPTRYRAVAGVA